MLGNCVASIVYDICATEKIFASNGQILLLHDKILLVEDRGQVVLYNLNSQEINLQVRGQLSYHATQAIIYVNSLVSIMSRNVIENHFTLAP